MIWFTADHHFGHANIIRYTDRPFQDVGEMHRELVRRWNAVVRRTDTVYHLGDLTLEGWPYAERLIRSLNGTIFFVPGNHDTRWVKQAKKAGYAHWCDQIHVLKTVRPHVVLCHYPLLSWPGRAHGYLHLHGHSHGTLGTRDGAIDVGVDRWSFTPVSSPEIGLQ